VKLQKRIYHEGARTRRKPERYRPFLPPKNFVLLAALVVNVLWGVVFPVPAFAQTSQTFYGPAGQANSIDSTTTSARTAVLGPAFTGVADDASALFSNPAGLASLSRGQVSLHSYFGLMDAVEETAILGLPLGGWGGLGLAGNYLNYGTFEGRDANGSLAPNYSPDRFGFQGGWGIEAIRELSLGLALHYSQQNITGYVYSSLVPDLGVLFKAGTQWKFGLDYQPPGWTSSSNPPISLFRVGASWQTSLDSSIRLLAALGNSLQSDSLDYLQAGAEASYRSAYILRAGYRFPINDNGIEGLSNFSMGAGVVLSDFELDYAYTPSGLISDSNQFSLTYFFGQPPALSTETAKAGLPGPTAGPNGVSGNGEKGPLAVSNPRATGSSPQAVTGPVTTASSTPPAGAASNIQGGTSGDASPKAVTVFAQPPPLVGARPQSETGKEDSQSLALHFDVPADFTTQGEQMAAQGKYGEALRLYQQAIQQDSQNVQAWWDMGVVYYKMNQKPYVIQCFQKVLELRPDDQALQQWLERYQAAP
jgi:hypothetical protein